jgi:hypothetical protein
MKGMKLHLANRVLIAVLAACLLAPVGEAMADSGLDVGARLKGAPTTVVPPEKELPPVFRPNCRWQYVRQYDANLGWHTRRVMTCD